MEATLDCQIYTGGIAQTNGYLVRPVDGGGPVVLIDAPAGIAGWLRQLDAQPDWLLLTHHHFDHVENAAAVAAMGARVLAFTRPTPDLTLESVAASWGMPMTIQPFAVDQRLEEMPTARNASAEGDATVPGWHALPGPGGDWRWAHVPGHSPDSVVFHLPGLDWLFAGDTLFADGIGRTDLPGGDQERLINGLRSVLLALPGSTRVLPGHGPETTIGREAAGNPYVGAMA